MVDNGSFMLVPTATNNPATTRFTAALMWSKAAPSGSTAEVALKRESIHLPTRLGISFAIEVAVFWVERTTTRATALEPNISSPSSCRDKSTEVFTTFWAFLEKTNDITINTPATTKKMVGVCADSISEVIR